MSEQQLFKCLRKGGRSNFTNFAYDLPSKAPDGTWTPGAWTQPISRLVECVSGYHLCTATQLPRWLSEELYLAEGTGPKLDCDNEVVFSSVRLVRPVERWNEKTARLWMADVAEHVLPVYESWCPSDDRVRKCIEVARDYANRLEL